MTGADVLRIVKERGFSLRLYPGPPPMPVLRDPGGHLPPPNEPLFTALRAYRDEIVALLSKESETQGG